MTAVVLLACFMWGAVISLALFRQARRVLLLVAFRTRSLPLAVLAALGFHVLAMSAFFAHRWRLLLVVEALYHVAFWLLGGGDGWLRRKLLAVRGALTDVQQAAFRRDAEGTA